MYIINKTSQLTSYIYIYITIYIYSMINTYRKCGIILHRIGVTCCIMIIAYAIIIFPVLTIVYKYFP